jgi:hypothetical protein
VCLDNIKLVTNVMLDGCGKIAPRVVLQEGFCSFNHMCRKYVMICKTN